VSTASPLPGFADPTRDAQRAFRAVLGALAHPTRSFPLTGPTDPPAALGAGLAAVALTLLDEDCAVWLGGALAHDDEVAAWLAFHTGARRANTAAEADFVIADPATLPPLASLALGTDEAPHLSATVVLDVRGCAGLPNTGLPKTGLPNTGLSNTRFPNAVPARFRASGPGIDCTATLTAPWAADDFSAEWNRNTGIFPRGVDLLLVDDDTVAALPRTTRLTAALTAADQELED
jgi:alpha-D-ribose 1-methylphosphonate 5-triphosphate synthase subunit PhnH